MKSRLLSVFFLLVFFFNLSAQDKVYQTKRAERPPKIDGLFDDAVWSDLEWVDDFTQFEPENGKAPSEKTGFKILYDDDNLYVAIRSYDSEPDKIEQRLTRRDGFDGDICGIQIDSYFDKRTAFVFLVNAAGVKNDGFFSNDGDDFDDSWDPIWEVKTKVDTEGWNAEMKIPLSQLRFAKKEQQLWGLQVVRSLYRNDELSTWKFVPKDAAGWVNLFGELQGIEHIKPRKQVEIAPFTVVKSEFYEKEDGNPFADGTDFGINAGVDGKIGLTNDLILDFAINPDFGQVEADPSEVNLSAFETFFKEKRPFFIEGNNITNFQLTLGNSPWSSDNLFYSRRIGRAPRGYPDLADGEYAKVPNNTRILGAFKVTGKTKKGWSIGIIESITNNEKAVIANNGTERKELIEPLTNYFVARLQKDINKGNTLIGGMITSTNRSIKNDELRFLPTSAISGGFDFTQYFKEKKYFISTQFATSQIKGDKEAILDQQLSSRRYFQRPDADYLELDSTRTSLMGTGGTFVAGKITNSGLRYLFNFTWRSPGLELNDVGFQRQGNSMFQFLWVGYSIDEPFSIFRSMHINANQWAGWDFGGTNLFKGGNINWGMQFKNFWSFNMGINREGADISNTALRGGPSLFLPGNWNVWTSLSTNSRKKLRLNAGMSLNIGDEGFNRSNSFWGGITYRPVNSLSVSLAPEFNIRETDLQYIDETEFEGDPRYVFGSLNQKTFNLTARIDFNITPDLTIQYYGSPFVSGGSYFDFKRITDPKADHLLNRYQVFTDSEISYDPKSEYYNIDELLDNSIDYRIEKPDFNFRQFRSNLVFRWEYVPGSVVFFVWSQGRTDFVSDGDFNFKNDIKDLFKLTPRNIFLVKLSYRFRAEQWF